MRRQAQTQTHTHTASDSDALHHNTPLPPSLPFAGLAGIDVASELMEQGEHRLAVNRRRWRRDQGALEAPLCAAEDCLSLRGSNILDLRSSPWNVCKASQRLFGFVFLGGWGGGLVENMRLKQINDTKVPKPQSPVEHLWLHNRKNIFPLINVVFLDAWLSLADHHTRCSINYAWLDLNGFFTGRLGLVIREPTHVEQPCPPGRGITPVQRKPTLEHAENRGKHHFLLARIHLRRKCAIFAVSKANVPSAAWLCIP